MLSFVSDFLRRQFDFYRTDVVAVYALHDDSAAQPICRELTELYQGKKQIIFQELERYSSLAAKRLPDVKYHIFLQPAEYGRASCIVDFLLGFYGQKLIVIQNFNNNIPRPTIAHSEDSSPGNQGYIHEVESNMYKAVVENSDSVWKQHRHKFKEILSDLLLYHFRFKAQDYKERLLRFINVQPSEEQLIKAKSDIKEYVATNTEEGESTAVRKKRVMPSYINKTSKEKPSTSALASDDVDPKPEKPEKHVDKRSKVAP